MQAEFLCELVCSYEWVIMKLKISKTLSSLPTVDYRELKEFQGNLKDLSKENYSKLKKSLTEFGFIVPIFVWGDKVIDAHQRLRVLKKEKAEPFKIPYVEIEAANEQDAKKKLLAISSQYGKIIQEGFDEFTFDLDSDWLDETINFDALNVFEKTGPDVGVNGLTTDDDVPDVPEKPKSKEGDIYQLGLHRVMCGDSTNSEMVQKLLGEGDPVLMVTDPPYGVEYDPNWRNEAARTSKGMGNRCIGAGAVGKVLNDDKVDWTKAWDNFKGPVAYVWHAGKHAAEVQLSLEKSDFEIRSQIIWAKTRLIISRGHYHWQHEPCWYAVRNGATGNWNGDRSQTTLWTIEHVKSETGHGTQKPVEAMRLPIQNNSKKGEAVYDPFLGSGTTLIAAEKMGRTCYGMELSPSYVDVIVKRWEDFTGQKAVKVK